MNLMKLGKKVDTSLFSDGMYVDIEGVSKGKGYQGVMKLHNMSGGTCCTRFWIPQTYGINGNEIDTGSLLSRREKSI